MLRLFPVSQGLPVYHDEVVAEGVQAVIQGFLPGLEQLLGSKGYKNRRARRGQGAADINEVPGKGQAAHEGIFLLEVKPPKHAVMLLGDTGRLEDVRFQLLLGLAGMPQFLLERKRPFLEEFKNSLYAVFIITHDMELVDECCTHILKMGGNCRTR